MKWDEMNGNMNCTELVDHGYGTFECVTTATAFVQASITRLETVCWSSSGFLTATQRYCRPSTDRFMGRTCALRFSMFSVLVVSFGHSASLPPRDEWPVTWIEDYTENGVALRLSRPPTIPTTYIPPYTLQSTTVALQLTTLYLRCHLFFESQQLVTARRSVPTRVVWPN